MGDDVGRSPAYTSGVHDGRADADDDGARGEHECEAGAAEGGGLEIGRDDVAHDGEGRQSVVHQTPAGEADEADAGYETSADGEQELHEDYEGERERNDDRRVCHEGPDQSGE